MFRLIFLTFHGKQRYDDHHVHESPWSMLGPLIILAILSIIGGWLAAPSFWGGEDHFTAFLAPIFGGAHAEGEAALSEAAAHSLELTLAVVAVVAALIGFATAFWLYLRQPASPRKSPNLSSPSTTRLQQILRRRSLRRRHRQAAPRALHQRSLENNRRRGHRRHGERHRPRRHCHR